MKRIVVVVVVTGVVVAGLVVAGLMLAGHGLYAAADARSPVASGKPTKIVEPTSSTKPVKSLGPYNGWRYANDDTQLITLDLVQSGSEISGSAFVGMGLDGPDGSGCEPSPLTGTNDYIATVSGRVTGRRTAMLVLHLEGDAGPITITTSGPQWKVPLSQLFIGYEPNGARFRFWSTTPQVAAQSDAESQACSTP